MKKNSILLGAALAVLLTPSMLNNSTETQASGNLVGIVKRDGGTLVDGNGNVITNRKLGNFTAWKLGTTKTINGKSYYKVATNEWIEADSIEVQGATTQVTKISGIGTVLHGGAPVVGNNGDYNGQYLGNYTSWQVNAKKVVNGSVFYRVATDEWVSGEYMNVGTPTVTTGITKTPGYLGIIFHGGTVSSDDNGNITTNAFANSSEWSLDEKKTMNGQDYYRVATNQWIASDAMAIYDANGTPVNLSDIQANRDSLANSVNYVNFTAQSVALRDFYDTQTNSYITNPYGAGSVFTVTKIVKNRNGQYFFQVEPNHWLPADDFEQQSSDLLARAYYEPDFAMNVTK